MSQRDGLIEWLRNTPSTEWCGPMLEKAAAEIDRLHGALAELVECANLRGDCDLPAPPDDPKMWTARMQTAWNEARALVEGS